MSIAQWKNIKLYVNCKDEQSFKVAYIKNCSRDCKYFCIETEETIKGFPDVLCLDKYNKAIFMEFKYTNNGIIKFQPSQPAFYKMNSSLAIDIVALNAKTGTVHTFPVQFLFDPNSAYFMNDKAQVNLSRVEGF